LNYTRLSLSRSYNLAPLLSARKKFRQSVLFKPSEFFLCVSS